MLNETEITEPVADTEVTEVTEDSAENQDASTEEVQEEAQETKPEEPKEETLEEKAKRYGQSMADKALKTYQQKDAEKTKLLEEKDKLIAELQIKANEKEWDKATRDLFDEEVETKGEEVALKNKAHREALKKQVLEYQDNAEKVKRTASLLGGIDLETTLKQLGKPNLKEAVNFLDGAFKTHKAKETAWALEFPEDKDKLAKVKAHVDRLMKAQDQEHFDLIAESIKSEKKGTKAKQTFTGTRQDGGKGLDSYSTAELIEKGLKEERKKSGG